MIRTATLFLFVSLAACGGRSQAPAEVPIAPDSMVGQECAVCGMVVDEQPAPRGQVRHRGGEHRFTCSLGDLRAYVQAPNPLGAPTEVWVEDLGAGWDPAGSAADEKPWIAASEASYVVGLRRSGVMGLPVASFSSAEEAQRLAAPEGRKTTGWAELESTPFNAVP